MSTTEVVKANPFEIQRQESSGMIAVAQTRSAQEAQAMMVVAKKFPRDQEAAYTRIMQACKRKGLAEVSMYEYERGGTKITGPSIRLAEMLAQNWGNLDFGIIELEQKDNESSVMAYCVDLETNVRQLKVFAVPHLRHTRNGDYALTDPRDIYENVANNGARRLRSCILGVIPGDIQDAALEACHQTLTHGKEPLIDRIRIMSLKFAEDFQVSQQMIERRLGHKLDAISEIELVSLRKIFTSLRDGMSKREDWFSLAESPDQSVSDRVAQSSAGPGPVPNETLGESKPRTRKSRAASATKAEEPDTTPAPEQAPEPLGPPLPPGHPAAPLPPEPGPKPVVQPVIGADKTRLGVVTAMRKAALESGVTEAQLNAACGHLQFGPPDTLLTQLPSETLGEIMSIWGEFISVAKTL